MAFRIADCGHQSTSELGAESLAAATTGTGDVVAWSNPKSVVTMRVVGTGTISGGTVVLEGSMQDDSSYVQLGSVTAAASAQAVSASGQAWAFYRARITANITGGGSITARILAA